jgi:hypothetical protein
MHDIPVMTVPDIGEELYLYIVTQGYIYTCMEIHTYIYIHIYTYI